MTFEQLGHGARSVHVGWGELANPNMSAFPDGKVIFHAHPYIIRLFLLKRWGSQAHLNLHGLFPFFLIDPCFDLDFLAPILAGLQVLFRLHLQSKTVSLASDGEGEDLQFRWEVDSGNSIQACSL